MMFDPLYKWRWKPIHNQFRSIALILIVPWKPLYKTEENNRCIADGIKVVESPWWIPSIDKQIQRIIYVFEFHFKRNETFFLLHSSLLRFWTILIIEWNYNPYISNEQYDTKCNIPKTFPRIDPPLLGQVRLGLRQELTRS